MSVKRREFFKLAAAGTAGGLGLTSLSSCEATPAESKVEASALDNLQNMTGDAKPITREERLGRISKAQRLMEENGISAIYLDSGTSMVYFTGVRWGQSERMMAAIIPVNGDVYYICPGFEEERLRELISIGDEVRVWQEHESPYKVVAQSFSDKGITTGAIGYEERCRFFLFDGIRKEASNLEHVSADAVTIPCRMYKTPTELALMQKAHDVTLEAYKVGISMLEAGMYPSDFIAITREATSKLGASGSIWCSFGAATAFPHGSSQPQTLKEGDVVLMDGGCGVHGYRSDISRTIVFGEPTDRHREIWNLEKEAQTAGFNAAILGDPCENVDIAARKVIVDAGFGPGYEIPGLPHRTGHGIGMDGHEWGNMVLGNKTPLSPGMCFSIEPMIAIYGEFGVRHEDCAYMTEEGIKWFSQPSPSIEQPIA